MFRSIRSTIKLSIDECLLLISHDEWNRTDYQKSLSVILALAYGVAATTREANGITKSAIEHLETVRKSTTKEHPIMLRLRSRSTRTVALNERLFELLIDQRNRAMEQSTEYLFRTVNENAFHMDTISAHFRARAYSMGLPPKTRLSDLRWAGIQHMNDAGLPLLAITQALDIHTPKTAANIVQSLSKTP